VQISDKAYTVRMVRKLSQRSAGYLFGSLAFAFLVGCSSTPDLASSVQLKRGARLRIIDLTGNEGEAKLANKSIPVFSVDQGIAWFSFVPAKPTKLEMTSATKEISMEAEKDYTVTVGQGGQLTVFVSEPPKPTLGGWSVAAFNSSKIPAQILTPKEAGSLSTGEVSESVGFEGKTKVQFRAGTVLTPSVEKLEENGIYALILFDRNGKPQAKIVHTNPPMSVAGASQGR
jgi:hypothetical protein